MKIFDHFQHINLTNDQRNALEKLHAFLESDERVFILQGYAGSGKTTLLKGFVEYLKSLEKKYQLMAPTGRAAKSHQRKTNKEATTIHRGIYNFASLDTIEAENELVEEQSYHYVFLSIKLVKIKTFSSLTKPPWFQAKNLSMNYLHSEPVFC
ncbi:MAG: tRNA (adenosine(37)-N6)-threonylcarbamoyltransferase complex ATPase subunit type 1 TsaE [Crocinitomicaceae bacterium]|nr:tRNA (adenosine(37)-N6)-threonylcarbamoyltransferase complex ATPase subunit type 1 TsaE [Crocinitomicaceae bacterium]